MSVCLRVCVCVCVCVCVYCPLATKLLKVTLTHVVSPPRLLITSYVKGTRNNRIMKFYGYSVSLYDITIDKLNGHSLSNTSDRERLPKKSQVMRY